MARGLRLQLPAVVLGGAFQHLAQRGLVLRAACSARCCSAGSIGVFGHGHADLLRQVGARRRRKLMPGCSIRKRMASPCAPQPKQ